MLDDDQVAVTAQARACVNDFTVCRSNKGVDIAGTQGQPVVAAADGKVVYAGSGLRGYGN